MTDRHISFGGLGKKGGLHHELTNIFLPQEAIEDHLIKLQATFAWLKQDTKCQDTWLAGLVAAQADQHRVLK